MSVTQSTPRVISLTATLIMALLLPATGGAQATRKAPDLTLVLLSWDRTPAKGVQVEVIDNSVETVHKSASGNAIRKPGELILRARSDAKGEISLSKIAAGTYAYEAGDPETPGYANGQFKIEDTKKPLRIEIVLSKPLR